MELAHQMLAKSGQLFVCKMKIRQKLLYNEKVIKLPEFSEAWPKVVFFFFFFFFWGGGGGLRNQIWVPSGQQFFFWKYVKTAPIIRSQVSAGDLTKIQSHTNVDLRLCYI